MEEKIPEIKEKIKEEAQDKLDKMAQQDNNIEQTSLNDYYNEAYLFNAGFDNDYISDFYDEF